MAPPAGEASRRAADDLKALLAPTPERIEFAFRLALICALTTLVTETWQTPSPALSAYVVFFLNRPDRTTSLIMDLALMILITIIIAIVLLLAMAVADQPGWRVAAMAATSFALLFVASASKLRPLGGIIAMIVAYALDLLGSVPVGELATRGLLYAWLFIAIPAGMSLAVNLLIGPAPRRLAERALARRLRAAAAMLGQADAAARTAFPGYMAAGVGEILGRLHLAGVEKTSPARDIAALTQAAHSTTAILYLADALAHDPAVPAAWRDAAATTLEEMAAILDTGGYPVAIVAPDGHDSASPAAQAMMTDFADALARFTDPPAEAPAPAAKAPGGFFLPDAFTSPVHVRYALKTTGAAMICYLLYSLLDWPGIHTCLITCYIVALGTAAETVEKLTLRILGCLLGAGAGIAAIVYVMPPLTSIGGLMAVVFAGGLVSAWVAAGSPRIAYAGFQIAFAFFLCVIQGAGPAFDLTVARDRVIGILLGNLVTWLVFTRVWPVSVTRRIDPAIATLLRQLGGMARASLPSRRRLAPVLQTGIATVKGDLALARYEPVALRPSGPWLDRRRETIDAIVATEGPLLLSGDDAPAFLHATADRLDRLADGFAGEVKDGSGTGIHEKDDDISSPRHALHQRVNDQLDMLEQALAR
ncbi:MAG TPA: FUSC family protein [Sphingomonas sp.]